MELNQPLLIHNLSALDRWKTNNYHSRYSRWLGRGISLLSTAGIPATFFSGIRSIMTEQTIIGVLLLTSTCALSLTIPTSLHLSSEERYDEPKVVKVIYQHFTTLPLDQLQKLYRLKLEKFKYNGIIDQDSYQTIKKIFDDFYYLTQQQHQRLDQHSERGQLTQQKEGVMGDVEQDDHSLSIQIQKINTQWESIQKQLAHALPNPKNGEVEYV